MKRRLIIAWAATLMAIGLPMKAAAQGIQEIPSGPDSISVYYFGNSLTGCSGVEIKLPEPLCQGRLNALWFDPRDGRRQSLAVDAAPAIRFAPPMGWPDAVLELHLADAKPQPASN